MFQKEPFTTTGSQIWQIDKRSTPWRHPANLGNSGFEAEWVRALGALRSVWSKEKLAGRKRQETQFLSNEDKEKWIEDCVERETAVASKRVEDAETAIKQTQDDMGNAEKAGLTTTKPERTFEEMLNAIGDRQIYLASSNNGENGEDEDDDEDDPAGGKLSEDDEPRWVRGTISKTVQYRMERYRQKEMKFDELTKQAGETRPTTSVREIRSTGRLNWRFWLSFNLKWQMMRRYLCRWHLVSLWRLLIASPENRKCWKWLLDQGVVIWG